MQANIAAGEIDVICPRCRTKTLISEGVAKIRERNPDSDKNILALRKRIEERTAEDAASAKKVVAIGDIGIPPDEPIRILHISDLHFTDDTAPRNHLVPLLQDIRQGEFLGFKTVEYLVITGDMTDRGSDQGFEKARQFVQDLIGECGLSAQRCIFVPGNHDVQEIEECYRWFGSESKARKYDADETHWHREGGVIFVEDQETLCQAIEAVLGRFLS